MHFRGSAPVPLPTQDNVLISGTGVNGLQLHEPRHFFRTVAGEDEEVSIDRFVEGCMARTPDVRAGKLQTCSGLLLPLPLLLHAPTGIAAISSSQYLAFSPQLMSKCCLEASKAMRGNATALDVQRQLFECIFALQCFRSVMLSGIVAVLAPFCVAVAEASVCQTQSKPSSGRPRKTCVRLVGMLSTFLMPYCKLQLGSRRCSGCCQRPFQAWQTRCQRWMTRQAHCLLMRVPSSSFAL